MAMGQAPPLDMHLFTHFHISQDNQSRQAGVSRVDPPGYKDRVAGIREE